MNEQKSSLITWIKEHKEELISAGICITALISAIICIKNKNTILHMWKTVKKTISTVKNTSTTTAKKSQKIIKSVNNTPDVTDEIVEIINEKVKHLPFEVKGHPRTLPEGQHPSRKQLKIASDLGVDLLPNQTWVKNYTKGSAA